VLGRGDAGSGPAPAGSETRGEPGAAGASGQAAPQRSPFDVPSVSLPKGGGAIRGIGEKFAANPVTGTGSMTVPLGLSPGRDGFGPQLSLTYDSGAGDGPFGIGWSPGLPAITRKTDKGLPRYDDAADSDVFILSGSEDLVPVLKQDAAGEWVRDASGRHVPDTEDRDGFTVRRYRPRVEGLYARIERWTRQSDGDVHWRSISRHNITTLYGRDTNSRVADPADQRRVYSWLICESFDDKGNAVVYQYKLEDSGDVDTAQAHERNRSPLTRSAGRLPKRILYGNRVSRLVQPDLGRAEWLFEAVFDYGEHDRDVPTAAEQGTWLCRNDPHSSYRAGFEVRGYRLCQRVLMFHHLHEPGVGADCLVRSTDIVYRDSRGVASDRGHGNPLGSFIASVTQSGYVRSGAGYLKKSMPAVEFGYSEAVIQADVRELDADSLANLPAGLSANCRWVDLDGEGVSGILTEEAGAWFYKANLGGGRFGLLELVRRRPTLAALGDGRQQLLDLDGSGHLDLVEFSGGTPGFFERTDDRDWASFTAFASSPAIAWDGPDLRFIDLDGDGHADVLITGDDAYTWHQSLAEAGFGPARRVAGARDEELGPRLVFADGTQSVYLADMSGDGLTDLVRIRNGAVCYWPNLGHGRFGAKVTMDRAPWFDHADRFHHERVRLADIDGSGTADLIYLRHDGVFVYFNEAGNGWGAARRLSPLPHVDNMSAVTTADLLGNGTACLVWSSSLPGDARLPVRYVDLMGGQKPHLLVSVDNNLGAGTRISYVSSTVSYLGDKAAGTPWVTKLPFPVHVVDRVEVHDRVSHNRFVTRYTYHHGYFDGPEREFRGFGQVDQIDTENFDSLGAAGAPSAANLDAASHVPPVLVRTWYHTGAYLGRDRISNVHAGLAGGGRGEYYREPAWLDDPLEAAEHLLPDTVLPAGLPPEDEREACRALKGSMLRQEVYALDGTGSADYPYGHPYTVLERNFGLRVLQPRGDNLHAVCAVHEHEMLNLYYERNPDDPRTRHELVLEVDEFGNVLKSASVGYGRRRPSPEVPEPERTEQTRTLITYTENSVTNAVTSADDHRTPLPSETTTFELTGYSPTGPAGRCQDSDLVRPDPAHPGRLSHVFDTEIAFEQDPTAGRQRRLIGRVRTLYRRDDLSGLLPFGGSPSLEAHALPGVTYELAFTPGLLAGVYQHRLPAPAEALGPGPDRGGYRSGQDLVAAGEFPVADPEDHWWKPSGRNYLSPDPAATPAQELDYARKHFFQPRRYRSPFHTAAAPTETVVGFDPYDLLIAETRDALGNVSTVVTTDDTGSSAVRIDYRVLQPYWMTDPNGNRVRVAFDALGLVTGTAVMGKGLPAAAEGDSLTGFEADLNDSVALAHLADPLAAPRDILGRASTRLVYDLFAYQRTKTQAAPQPVAVYTLARETHDSDPVPGGGLRTHHTLAYSDGFGRVIQQKAQAEPGPVPVRGADGGIVVGADGQPVMTAQPAASRWIGTGWTVFNNKGKPVRQFEPFFTDSHGFESDVRVGVSPVVCYDPVERVVATLHPDHTWQKVVFDPWRQETWDPNDTVQVADPRTDPDVGGHFRRLPDADHLPTWYQQRADGTLGPEARDAARKTAVHAGTPAVTHADALGRTVLSVAHNRFIYSDAPAGAAPVEEFHRTRVVVDVQGHQRAVLDEYTRADEALEQRAVMRYDYDLAGHRVHQASMEAGERWLLADVAGKPLYTWDSRGHRIRTVYDRLRRPTDSLLQVGGGAEMVVERRVYGEAEPTPEAHNLRGRLVRHFDPAGLVTVDEVDFKGNPLIGRRQVVAVYDATPNWAAAPALSGETFLSRTRFDALNRPIQSVPPHSDQAGAVVNVLQPVYNEAGLLKQIHVWLDRAAEPTGLLDATTADLHSVTGIDYDAKRQRTMMSYGNGTTTAYSYDPHSFRLVQLVTRRDPAVFPDDCPEPPSAAWPGCQVQNLTYTYDPVGNVTHIRDDAQQTRFFRNRRVEPSADYTYDAVYRLIEATGREHLGQAGAAPTPNSYNDRPRVGIALSASDGTAVALYLERYLYDEVGNIRQLIHRGTDPAAPGWTRAYDYSEASQLEPGQPSNRLTATTIGATTGTYSSDGDGYDPHGNLLRMPQLQTMQWDFRDHLSMTCRQPVDAADADGTDRKGERTYYTYDAAGERVRKVTVLPTGEVKDERLYLGGYEVYRRYGIYPLTRATLHVMGDKQRVALIETRTQGDEPGIPRRMVRYQYGNHLGSACLELDETAQIVSYEEYTPYGSTSFAAVRSQTETPKRYRYTGKERDEESGLYYHGARYYAAWLGRWVDADPGGLVDGPNLYGYVRGNPAKLIDPSGRQSLSAATVKIGHDRVVNVLAGLERDQRLTESLGAVRDPKLGVQGRPDLKTWDSQFKGKRGEQFRQNIGAVAKEMGVDPGLLAANALAEADTRDFWLNGVFTYKKLSSTERASDVAGLDFWESMQAGVKAAVPAAKDIPHLRPIGWFLQETDQELLKKITDKTERQAFIEKHRLPVVGFADAKTALRALAAMTKWHQLQLEKQLGAETWGSFTDAERFALSR